MDVLVEIHNEEELHRALKLKTKLLGVNNRNLKTMVTDISMTEKLASLAPTEKILISESGLQTPADLHRMASAGARCFLIGESIMKQKDIEKATKLLLKKSTQENV
jgi:indole-3-glycerol phosphate synthase